MLLRWYGVLFVCWIGSLLINITYGQDDEPEARVILTIDTRPKSFFDARSSEESFACYECIDCQEKFNQTIRICQPDVDMCFTTYTRINKTNRIVRRGCSTSRGQCIVPVDHDEQVKSFDSVTCCIGPKCNQGVQTRSLVIVLLLNLSLLMVIYI